jgi:hypothetical protein
LKDQATALAGQAAGQLGGLAQSAGGQIASGKDAVQQLAGNLFGAMGDNPILLGAVGLTVGALLGALVPQSEAEEAALSGMAGTVRGTVTDVAQQVVDRGGDATKKLVEGARDSAQSRGLSGDMSVTEIVQKAGSGELLGSVKDVALDALRAGEGAVRGDEAKTSGKGPDQRAAG